MTADQEKSRIRHLEERVAYLEEMVRYTRDALELAATFGSFHTSMLQLPNPFSIVQRIRQRLSRITEFKATAFYLVKNEESEFQLFSCLPNRFESFLNMEFPVLVEDGTFAFAVDGNRPVIVRSKNGNHRLLLHVMTTIARVRGMFIGILDRSEKKPTEMTLSLITVLMANGASALESFELYKQIGEMNVQLRAKVSHLAASRKELRKHKNQLEELVEKRTQKLVEAMAAVNMANRAKSDFLAVMSHELLTPLNAVLGFSGLLKELAFGSLNEKQLQYVGNIEKAGKRLHELIQDVLDFSRKNKGPLTFKPKSHLLGKIVEEAVEPFFHKNQNRICFTVDLPEELEQAEIRLDLPKFRQILFNLISNAFKFTPGKGKITIAIRKVDAPVFPPGSFSPMDRGELHNKGILRSSYLQLDVADTGVGLDREEMKTVFIPFGSGKAPYARIKDGAHLGLALTRRLVELHKGRIWVRSRKSGPGVVFSFVLPFK